MAAYEVYIPSEGQARRFYESLSPAELEEVQRLLYLDIENHPLPEDPEPGHLIKIAFPVGRATNGVLSTDGRYYFYYHFPEPGIISVVAMGRARPPFVDLFAEQ